MARGQDQQKSTPSVTVIMPVFNGDRYLKPQIISILKQQGVNLHLIVLDDHSTDGSLPLLLDMASKDHRISVLQNSNNLGLMRTLARLFSEVRDEFLSLADQDDIWDADKLIRSIDQLNRTGAILVYSDVRVIDSEARIITRKYLRSRRLKPVTGKDPVPFIFRNPAIGHTIVARGSLAQAAQNLPPSLQFHEAWIIGLACRIGFVTYLDQQLGSYRQHDSNVVGAKVPLMKRLMRIFSSDEVLLLHRQQTRALAIEELAQLFPSLAPIADLLHRKGFNRLPGTLQFAAFLLPYAKRIGIVPVLIEIILYPLSSPADTLKSKTYKLGARRN